MAIRKSDKTYLEALLELTNTFSEQLSDLKDRVYPSTCPLALVNCLLKSSQILLDRIQQIISSSNTAQDRVVEDLLSQASDIYVFIEFFQSYVLPIIRASDSNNVPAELVRPLEQIAGYVFPGSNLVISSVPESNYYFSNMSTKVKELFASLNLESVLAEQKFDTQDIYHLQLSNNPPCNILSHCLLGHEIGHALYKKNNVDAKISLLIQFDDAVIKRIASSIFEALLSALSASQTPPQMVLQQTKEFIEYRMRFQLPIIAASWAEELFSDFIGTGLFGPAYICSLSVLTLPFDDIDMPSESHPPSRFRVQSCIIALNRSDPGFGYKKLVDNNKSDEYEALIHPWRDAVTNAFHRPTDDLYKTVFNLVLNIKDDIILESKKQLNTNAFSYSRFHAEVPQLRNRLIDWLPPNEYQLNTGDQFHTPSIQAIFNSGWLSYLEDMNKLLKLFPDFSELVIRKKFYQLIAKGIELSNIQDRWKTLSKLV